MARTDGEPAALDFAVDWSDVLDCFADRHNPQSVIERLTNEWADRYGLPHPIVGRSSNVHLERWSHIGLGIHLDTIAKIQPLMITDQKPRWLSGRIVVVDFGDAYGQIDGRRRANVWRHVPGTYEILVICAY